MLAFDSLYKVKICDMDPVSVRKSLLHLVLIVQSIIQGHPFHSSLACLSSLQFINNLLETLKI